MAGKYKEISFESAIENHLLTKAGYTKGDKESFDPERGLDPTTLLAFIQETQPMEWGYLKNIQKDKAEKILLDDLCRALDSEHEGCLMVRRHGFKCFGKLFRTAYFAPASGLNPETGKLYAAFLDRETERIDALIENIQNSIDLLREYRVSLISAAVTGKIDVREPIKA